MREFKTPCRNRFCSNNRKNAFKRNLSLAFQRLEALKTFLYLFKCIWRIFFEVKRSKNILKSFLYNFFFKEIIYLKLNRLSIDSEHNRLINTINTNKNRIKCSLCLCVIRKSFKINFWMHKSIIYTYCSVVCKAADCKIEIRKWNYKFCCMHLIE